MNDEIQKTNPPEIICINRCIIKNPSEPKALIIKRVLNDSYNPGLWEFPGGKLDAGQDVGHTLEREILEETGLLINAISRLVYFDSYVIGKGKNIGKTLIELYGIADLTGGILKLSKEHDDYAWKTYKEALGYELTLSTREALITLGRTALN